LEFLFGKDENDKSVNQGSNTDLVLRIARLNETIQNIQESYDVLRSQLNSLQQKVIHLEAKLFDLTISHSASFEENSTPDATKIIQQGEPQSVSYSFVKLRV
jgi:phage shock protein A